MGKSYGTDKKLNLYSDCTEKESTAAYKSEIMDNAARLLLSSPWQVMQNMLYHRATDGWENV